MIIVELTTFYNNGGGNRAEQNGPLTNKVISSLDKIMI